MPNNIRVTVWNEYRHEKKDAEIAKIYPDGIHNAIAKALRTHPHLEVRTATLDELEHGLTDEVLANTDVLTWWGHMAHGDVRNEIVDKVQQRVLNGMGLIVLHSGHFSKIFRRLMGTECSLKWREIGEKHRLWVTAPGHPIVEGLGEYFEIPHCEMYGEYFDIPQPDELVFISWFQGGEVFRSGCCFYRGRGKIFYFQPGHETFPIYHQPEVLQVIANAVRWAAPVKIVGFREMAQCPNIPEPMEVITLEE
ncbi:MAG: ThuA domain-containing protein [Anaerolineae bacterium]|nr:ThuA domain-containing protein [Anaerolineae bacterium]